jgi:hypothetical protein
MLIVVAVEQSIPASVVKCGALMILVIPAGHAVEMPRMRATSRVFREVFIIFSVFSIQDCYLLPRCL